MMTPIRICLSVCLLIVCLGMMPAVSAQAQVAPDFVEAVVDHTTAFVGEPILYTWRWYLALANVDATEQSVPVGLPKFDAFGQEKQEITTESTIRSGQTYQVITQQIVLYPLRVGVYTLDPIHIVMPETPYTPETPIQSAAIMLTIRPLPANAPATFGNAVGQFDLKARLDRQEAKTGEPLTLIWTITGAGNGPLITTPVLNPGAAWRVYGDKSTTRRDGPLLGERVFTWSVIPLQPGTLIFPSQNWTFFNPQTSQYETRATEPFPVSVTGKAIAEPQANALAATPTLYPLDYGPMSGLYRDDSTGREPPAIMIDYHGPRTASPRSGIDELGVRLIAFPPGIALLVWLWGLARGQRRKEGAVPQKQKGKGALQPRLRALAETPPHEVALGILEILRASLSQKFGVAITADDLDEAIQRLPADMQAQWHACVDLAKTARYAPFTQSDAQRLIRDAERAINRAEAL